MSEEKKVVEPVVERQRCEVYSRVVGYLRPVSQWNEGKQQEYKEKKVYKYREEEK